MTKAQGMGMKLWVYMEWSWSKGDHNLNKFIWELLLTTTIETVLDVLQDEELILWNPFHSSEMDISRGAKEPKFF